MKKEEIKIIIQKRRIIKNNIDIEIQKWYIFVVDE